MSILDPLQWNVIDFPSHQQPLLLVIVDAEEEFDWEKPLSRESTAVTSIAYQYRAQQILEKHGIKPIYVVDFPVANQESGFRPLREWLDEGRCDIGAQLHSWVNPPFTEEVSTFTA